MCSSEAPYHFPQTSGLGLSASLDLGQSGRTTTFVCMQKDVLVSIRLFNRLIKHIPDGLTVNGALLTRMLPGISSQTR